MKIKILFFFLLVNIFLFSFIDSLALQITKVSGPKTSPWLELFNNSDSITNIKDIKLFTKSATNTSAHSVTLGSKAISFDIQPNTYFILADDPGKTVFNNLSCQIFDTSFDLIIGQSLSYDSLEYQIDSADSLTNTSCTTSDNQNNNSTSTATTTNSTSTNETNNTNASNIVYVYVPTNNQNKYGDIQVLLPEEKIVPAGAEVEYSVKVVDSQKNILSGLDFNWSFGDGGEKFDKNTSYHYVYPGEYTLIVSADGFSGGAQAKMKVLVISPDVIILKVGTSSKENFIDLQNKTDHDLFLSNFYLSVDNVFYKLPKNFVIAKGKTTHVSGEALGFKLPALNISLNYPNKNILTSYSVKIDMSTSSLLFATSSTSTTIHASYTVTKVPTYPAEEVEEKGINKKIVILNNNTEFNESLILKHLILNESLNINEKDKKIVPVIEENVKNSENVDIGVIRWLKSLVY